MAYAMQDELPSYIRPLQDQVAELATALTALEDQFDGYLAELDRLFENMTLNTPQQHDLQQQSKTFIHTSHQYFTTKLAEYDEYYRNLALNVANTIDTLSTNIIHTNKHNMNNQSQRLKHSFNTINTTSMGGNNNMYVSLLQNSLRAQSTQLQYLTTTLMQQMSEIESNCDVVLGHLASTLQYNEPVERDVIMNNTNNTKNQQKRKQQQQQNENNNDNNRNLSLMSQNQFVDIPFGVGNHYTQNSSAISPHEEQSHINNNNNNNNNNGNNNNNSNHTRNLSTLLQLDPVLDRGAGNGSGSPHTTSSRPTRASSAGPSLRDESSAAGKPSTYNKTKQQHSTLAESLANNNKNNNTNSSKIQKNNKKFTSSAVQQTIVDKLERSKQTMHGNVEKGSAAHHELVASSEILALIQQDAVQTKAAAQESANLTKKYELKALFNKNIVRWTFLLFLIICTWIVSRRMLWFATPLVYANRLAMKIAGFWWSLFATIINVIKSTFTGGGGHTEL